ncbi:MAG: hypothetical protein ACRDOI_21315, partial [Trebonia sp.]
MTPANRGQAPFDPEVSWSNGDYGYPATRAEQRPALNPGAHPYAAFGGTGYGDDGYQDPGYQGPAAQDAGIAGTRTVRGFVESGQHQQGYPETGYAQSGYSQSGYPQSPPGAPYSQPGYAGSSYAAAGEIELAYPLAADGANGADLYQQDLYQQPWDYDQPLRYDGEEPTGDYGQTGAYGNQANDGAVRYQPPAFDPNGYNGSEYSMPGINGPGYDLSGIIGTSDFEAVGYDEPGYGRLSYDDPRYDDAPRNPQSPPRFDETRFDVPRFDDTRLDNGWQAGEDVRREAGPAGYGNDGFGASRNRSESPAAFNRGRGGRSPETRYDMRALVEPGDNTRFDVPVFDETRLDNLRPLTPGQGVRATGAILLAPPAAQPRSWAEDTSLDQFADLDLTDEPVPAAFTRTLERPTDLPQRGDDTGSRRAVGRRRGRSGDRRQWMALGAIAVVAAGAIGGVLMKYVFSGPSGPAHQVVAPRAVDSFTRSANLEKQLGVTTEAAKVEQASGGQASDLASAVYQMGSLT